MKPAAGCMLGCSLTFMFVRMTLWAGERARLEGGGYTPCHLDVIVPHSVFWLTEPATFVLNSWAGSFIWYTIINLSEQHNVSKAFDPGRIKRDEMLRLTEIRVESSFDTTDFSSSTSLQTPLPSDLIVHATAPCACQKRKGNCIKKKKKYSFESLRPKARGQPLSFRYSVCICVSSCHVNTAAVLLRLACRFHSRSFIFFRAGRVGRN